MVIAIAGSLRAGSYNAALLRSAVAMAPDRLTIEPGDIRDIPLYDGDLELAAFPAAVTHLKDRIAAADGLLLVTPEYNFSIPGVLKNTVDWLSRPPADQARIFGGKPVALMGATVGRLGTAQSQNAWLAVFRALGLRPWFGASMMVSRAQDLFDEQGQLVDTPTQERLQKFLAGFAAFVDEVGTEES